MGVSKFFNMRAKIIVKKFAKIKKNSGFVFV